MKKILLFGAAFALLALPAAAQQIVRTAPLPVTSANASGTITTTDTFQAVFLATNPAAGQIRQGCLIQNTSTHTQYVFFGPLLSATKAASFQLAAAASIGCAFGPVASQDAVSITGTATDTFVAVAQ